MPKGRITSKTRGATITKQGHTSGPRYGQTPRTQKGKTAVKEISPKG